MIPPSPPVVLTIAGSDSSAGAGIQADLKTFAALGTHGLSAVTSVIAEAPGRVDEVHLLPALLVGRQLDCLMQSYPIAAAKTGLLGTVEIIHEAEKRLQDWQGSLVVDPVAIASTGTSMVTAGYQEALHEFLRKWATLVTPNGGEAETLLGRPLENPAAAALEIADRLWCSVLLKGGHLDLESNTCTDYLVHEGKLTEITRERLQLGDVHGTGCTYSAAITAHLGQGLEMPQAVEAARDYLQEALRQSHEWSAPDGRRVKALEHNPKTGHQ